MNETLVDYAHALAEAAEHLRRSGNCGRRDDDLEAACPDRFAPIAACYPIEALRPAGR